MIQFVDFLKLIFKQFGFDFPGAISLIEIAFL